VSCFVPRSMSFVVESIHPSAALVYTCLSHLDLVLVVSSSITPLPLGPERAADSGQPTHWQTRSDSESEA
jgi:hypothetical protein